MNVLSDISDSEFIPFLNNLGADTFKQSFEWMLSDPDFAYVLRWMYNSLDENNILSAREEYRYSELENGGALLSSEELETSIATLEDSYPGICFPGDKDSMEEIKQDVAMQTECCKMLEKHKYILGDTVKRNEKANQELNVELTKLNSAIQQYSNDEKAVGEECISVAEEVEALTNDMIELTANALNVYGNCLTDVDTAKCFFTFGPYDVYKQSQALFKSHFDLYVSKKIYKKYNDFEMNQDLHMVPIKAKKMEDRLSNALFEFINSKAELSGLQAKLALIVNPSHVDPDQISSCIREAQMAVALLDQEEFILDQELQRAVQIFVDQQTRLVMEPIAKSALAVREQILQDLRSLQVVSSRALEVERVLYGVLRAELRAARRLLHFGDQQRRWLLRGAAASASRLKSMSDICTEQECAEQKTLASDTLLNTIMEIFGQRNQDPVSLHNKLKNNIIVLKEKIQNNFTAKEDCLQDIKNSTKPLRSYIWDGCTKKPNCFNRIVSALNHELRQEMEKIDERVIKTSGLFNSVKNGDSQNLRKLWQWYLTDQGRFLAAIKNIQ